MENTKDDDLLSENKINVFAEFTSFLTLFPNEKLGFILSQSSVEPYIRTEFAWYISQKYKGAVLYIESNRIDLQIIYQGVCHVIEFGHRLAMHNITIENLESKYTNDFSKFDSIKREKVNSQIPIIFHHIILISVFDKLDGEDLVRIDPNCATFRKYKNKFKHKTMLFIETLIDEQLHFSIPFVWRNSYGKFFAVYKTPEIIS